MTQRLSTDRALFAVVVNEEGQYSIWPAARPAPSGWTRTGVEGVRERCLAEIERAWEDMRPVSLARPASDAQRRAPVEPAAAATPGLGERLAAKLQPVAIAPRVFTHPDAIRHQVRTGVLPIVFPQTNGGTELHVRLDEDMMARASRGGVIPPRIVVSGTAVLDGEPLRLMAEFATKTGIGVARLERRSLQAGGAARG